MSESTTKWRILFGVFWFAITLSVTDGQENKDPAVQERDRQIQLLIRAVSKGDHSAAAELRKFGPAAKAAVPALTQALSSPASPELRAYAARALEDIGPASAPAVPALRRALADESRFVRQRAALALGGIGPQAGVAIPDLVPLLGDNDLYLRRAGSQALGQIGKEAIPSLHPLLEHQNPEIRYRATMALARMNDVARETLEKCLASESVSVRRAAAEAFASFYVQAPLKAVPALVNHLSDRDAKVHQWLATALVRCAPDSEQSMKALLGELEKDDARALEVVILLSQAAMREEFLEKLLKAGQNQRPPVQGQLIRAMGLTESGAGKATPELLAKLTDPDLGPRAAEALFRIAPKDAKVSEELRRYHSRHPSDVPYPGYLDDLKLTVRSRYVEGPSASFSAPEAVAAARRVFANVNFVGKTEQEVLRVLGDPRALSSYARAQDTSPPGQLVYCFDTGWGGYEYRLVMKDGRVAQVKELGRD